MLRFLIILDTSAAVLALLLGAIMLLSWWYTGKSRTSILARGVIYLAVSGRMQTGMYARYIASQDQKVSENGLWLWIAFIAGVVLIISLLREFWQILNPEIKVYLSRWLK